MLLSQEKAMLNEILEWEDADEAIQMMIQNYAKKSADNARHLLSLIPSVADIAVEHISKIVAQHAQASYWLMCQRKMMPDKSGMFFASMVPVCMARFPDGKAERCCAAEKEYFDLFLQQFSDSTIFTWEKDGRWADQNGYTKYLKLVERQMDEEKERYASDEQ